jgi:hypothetical protein
MDFAGSKMAEARFLLSSLKAWQAYAQLAATAAYLFAIESSTCSWEEQNA